MTRFLFGNLEGLHTFGGYDDAERKMLVYLPEYLDETGLMAEDSPVVCLRAEFYEGDSPGHRDFLGALMGLGVARETVGDICVDKTSCDFFVTEQVAPFLLQNMTSAGRAKVRLTRIPLTDAKIPTILVTQIRDTLASVRLDSVISTAFRMGRSQAVRHISAGNVMVDGILCQKPDKILEQGTVFSLRGFGKARLTLVGGQTKKGRISIVIEKYM